MYWYLLTDTILLPIDRPLDALNSVDDNARIVFKNIFFVSVLKNKFYSKHVTKKIVKWLKCVSESLVVSYLYIKFLIDKVA